MVKIRLQRVGKKKKPSYRVVVADSRAPRDGAFIDIIGHYDPLTDPATVVIDEEKALKWLRDGAFSIGIQEHDRIDTATLIVRDGEVEVIPGRSADQYVEWSSVEAARVLLGGPPVSAAGELRGLLAALFPLPVFVPGLDHV